MDHQIILSLCIPTNGAVEWILPVIESIYAQEYDTSKFEVVITDNGKQSQLPSYIAKMNYPNLRYKQTDDEGFLNLVTCLKEGKGMFCKMINHRSKLLPGTIETMIDLVLQYKETQPLIYCSDGALKNRGEIIDCSTDDDFVRELSYWCSWSAGIGFWQKDLKEIETIDLNKMFPNTSMLFGCRNGSSYVIWNKKYQQMGDETGKGGYDLYKTFGVIFLDIMNSLRINHRITYDTFIKIKKDLFTFLRDLYLSEAILPTNRTFILKNIRQSMNVYYGSTDYIRMVVEAWSKLPVVLTRRGLAKIWRCIRHN